MSAFGDPVRARCRWALHAVDGAIASLLARRPPCAAAWEWTCRPKAAPGARRFRVASLRLEIRASSDALPGRKRPPSTRFERGRVVGMAHWPDNVLWAAQSSSRTACEWAGPRTGPHGFSSSRDRSRSRRRSIRRRVASSSPPLASAGSRFAGPFGLQEVEEPAPAGGDGILHPALA